jgi:predicted adenylyl cyclase CyaB
MDTFSGKCNKEKMKYEIERKAWLRDPDGARDRLAHMGRACGETRKDDRYYLLEPKAPGCIDMIRDPIFRIRTEGDRCLLTAKKRSFRGKTEINEEVEIPAGTPEETIRLFEDCLGLRPFVRKHKHTQLFEVNGLDVEINFVKSLGWFLEVEATADGLDPEEENRIMNSIDEVFDALGIREEDLEPRYYIEMLLRERETIG